VDRGEMVVRNVINLEDITIGSYIELTYPHAQPRGRTSGNVKDCTIEVTR
jgi:hypothetical protein